MNRLQPVPRNVGLDLSLYRAAGRHDALAETHRRRPIPPYPELRACVWSELCELSLLGAG